MKQIWFPRTEDWHLYYHDEEGYNTYVGGHAIISQGKVNPPIVAAYHWLYEEDEITPTGDCYCQIFVIKKGNHWDNDGDMYDGHVLDLADMAYSPEDVREANTEEFAVEMANEVQGGEADVIGDIKPDNDISDEEYYEVIYNGYINAPVDDHQSAIEFITYKVMEWAGY
jgi:hypothetical protein